MTTRSCFACLLPFAGLVISTFAAEGPTRPLPTQITSQSFGQLPDGRTARLFQLQSPAGLRADITDYGAIVVRLLVPDREGRLVDVILGGDSVGAYAARVPAAAIIGRVANRIAGAKFTLDGKTYTLAANSGLNHIHGGRLGFDKIFWQTESTTQSGQPAVRLRYLSKDGDGGYPGNLEVAVTYSLTADRGLRIDYQATADQATPVNLTNHAYFNLKGEGHGDVLDHELVIYARRFTPTDATLIPSGEIAPVTGTPLDFTTVRRIGDRIRDSHDLIRIARGYDHNFVLDNYRPGATEPSLAAVVREPASGLIMEVLTTEPGVQLYTANHFNGSVRGKSGQPYVVHGALCLETQHYPDSVNQPAFPSTILRPGQTFRSTTIYRFPRP
ncbi:MAG: galactose mutarotase [Verrucomicrobia bacterium]|nr:galactose mutarotase [Verrucomicrobiota bacterium]